MNIYSHSEIWDDPKYFRVVALATAHYCDLLDIEPHTFSVHLFTSVEWQGNFVWGLCEFDTRQVILSAKFNSLLDGDPLEYLAHELVHVKQFSKGELEWDDDLGDFWKGEYWGKTNVFKIEQHEYESLPWESEAFKLQGQMRESFRKEYGF